MANGFNFNAMVNTDGVAADKRLRAYTINKVKFVEAKIDVLHSEKNQTDYDVLKVRWEGEQGFYEENYFLPSTEGRDIERTPNNWGGENPSNADRAMMFFAHCCGVLNPDGYEKMKKVVGGCKNFKDVATLAAKVLNAKKGCECYLKLCGRDNNGVIYASLPFFTSINRTTGEAQINNNFLSLKDDLAFTPAEDKKRMEFENRKPTPAPDNTEVPASNNSDIDNATQDDLQTMLSDL